MAQEHTGITLVEAVQSTLTRHPSLQIQERQVDISRALKQQASGQFDTVLGWSANQNRVNSPLTVYQEEQAAAGGIAATNQAQNLSDSNFGAQKLFRNGISITPSWDLNRTTDNLTSQNGVNMSHVSVQVVLPLARNRGREVVAAQETSAQIGVDASLYDLAETAAELIVNTTVAYWNYVAASTALEVSIGAENRGRTLAENVKVMIDADRMARSELHDVAANLADRTATRIAAEQQLLQARQSLGVAMGLDVGDFLNIPPPADNFPGIANTVAPSTTLTSLQYYIDQALQRRADYLAAAKRVQSSNVLLGAAKNQLLPRWDVTLSTGYTGLGEGVYPNALFGAPFTRVQGVDAMAGIRYSFPIRNNFAEGQIQQASAAYSQANLQRSNIGRTIASNVIVAANSVANAIIRLQNAHEAVVAYSAALEGERDKLRLGVGSVVDVLTIEDRLTAALNSEVNARLTYATSLIQFRFTTGTILAPDRLVQSVSRDVLFTAPFPGVTPEKEKNP